MVRPHDLQTLLCCQQKLQLYRECSVLGGHPNRSFSFSEHKYSSLLAELAFVSSWPVWEMNVLQFLMYRRRVKSLCPSLRISIYPLKNKGISCISRHCFVVLLLLRIFLTATQFLKAFLETKNLGKRALSFSCLLCPKGFFFFLPPSLSLFCSHPFFSCLPTVSSVSNSNEWGWLGRDKRYYSIIPNALVRSVFCPQSLWSNSTPSSIKS